MSTSKAIKVPQNHTSDLWGACEADRYGGSRAVGGGVLGGRHTVGFVNRWAAAELSVFRWGGAEAWSLVVSSLGGRNESTMMLQLVEMQVTWSVPTLTGITAAGKSCLLRSPSSAPGRLWLTGLPSGRCCLTSHRFTNREEIEEQPSPGMLRRCWLACIGRLDW